MQPVRHFLARWLDFRRVDPESYKQILLASMAGGVAGALVMWNRKRSQTAGQSRARQLIVLTLGTAASACALIAFTQVFGSQSPAYAAIVVVLITGWTAVVNSTMPLPVPRFARRVHAREFAILRAPWTGVRLFGAFLRATPLRHLGGRVYLSEVGLNPLAILGGIRDAQAVHIWALLFSCPWLLWWGIQERWMSLACGLFIHAPLNIYPVLHLRYVTARLEAYLARRSHDDVAG